MFTVLCRHAHSIWQSTESFLYVIGKSIITSTWTYIFAFDIEEKQNLSLFYYIHIVEIPINRGTNSYKLNLSKKGILVGIQTLSAWKAIEYRLGIGRSVVEPLGETIVQISRSVGVNLKKDNNQTRSFRFLSRKSLSLPE